MIQTGMKQVVRRQRQGSQVEWEDQIWQAARQVGSAVQIWQAARQEGQAAQNELVTWEGCVVDFWEVEVVRLQIWHWSVLQQLLDPPEGWVWQGPWAWPLVGQLRVSKTQLPAEGL